MILNSHLPSLWPCSVPRDFVLLLLGGRLGLPPRGGWRPASRCVVRVVALSPQTLNSGCAAPGLGPAGLLSLPAASFSSDSNPRLFRYVRLLTKDCNSSSFVWEGTTAAAGVSWAGRGSEAPGGGAAGGWGAAGLRPPPRPSLWYSLRFLYNAVMLIR